MRRRDALLLCDCLLASLSLDLTMVQKVIAGAVAVAILVVVINFAEVRWRMTDEAGRNKSG